MAGRTALKIGQGRRLRMRWFGVLLAGLAVAGAGLVEQAVAAPVAGEFGWPLRPRPAIERRFDKPARNWLPGHRGVDLAGMPGQAVLAAGDGIVVFAGEVAGKPVVSIDHPGGVRTTYEPVEADVAVGRRVVRGAPIGTLQAGHEGCAVACLHWGARRDSSRHGAYEYLDPLALLRISPVRLKPVTPTRISSR